MDALTPPAVELSLLLCLTNSKLSMPRYSSFPFPTHPPPFIRLFFHSLVFSLPAVIVFVIVIVIVASRFCGAALKWQSSPAH